MAELTDDELEAIKLQARESVDYEAAGCVRGSRMGLRLADAAERRALYEAGRRQVLDALYGLSGGLTTNGSPELWAWLDEYGFSQMSGLGSLLRCLAATRDWIEPGTAAYRRICTEPPLSCGCPPEHHDEAKRRLADRMRRDGVISDADAPGVAEIMHRRARDTDYGGDL